MNNLPPPQTLPPRRPAMGRIHHNITQINNLKIRWSDSDQKWQVGPMRDNKLFPMEEFVERDDAIRYARGILDFSPRAIAREFKKAQS